MQASEGIAVESPLLKDRARLVPVRSPEFAGQVMLAAKADDHVCIAPTHAMLRGEKIIGYLSLGGMPVVQSWFDSKSGHVLDSLKMIEMGEAIIATQAREPMSYMVAVSEQSPFRPHMERLGFKPVMTTTLWVKSV